MTKSNRINFVFQFRFISSSASPESGLGTSHTSLPGSGQGSANDQVMNEDMYYEAEPLQALGTCKALYPFDGKRKIRTHRNAALIYLK